MTRENESSRKRGSGVAGSDESKGHQTGNVGSLVGHLANRQHFDPADSGIPSSIYEYLPSGIICHRYTASEVPALSRNHSDKGMSSCVRNLNVVLLPLDNVWPQDTLRCDHPDICDDPLHLPVTAPCTTGVGHVNRRVVQK
jgi:hypothetical protein